MTKMPMSTDSLTPSVPSAGLNSARWRPIAANSSAEPTARIFTERPRTISIATVARQIAEATKTLIVAEVTSIRKVKARRARGSGRSPWFASVNRYLYDVKINRSGASRGQAKSLQCQNDVSDFQKLKSCNGLVGHFVDEAGPGQVRQHR